MGLLSLVCALPPYLWQAENQSVGLLCLLRFTSGRVLWYLPFDITSLRAGGPATQFSFSFTCLLLGFHPRFHCFAPYPFLRRGLCILRVICLHGSPYIILRVRFLSVIFTNAIFSCAEANFCCPLCLSLQCLSAPSLLLISLVLC